MTMIECLRGDPPPIEVPELKQTFWVLWEGGRHQRVLLCVAAASNTKRHKHETLIVSLRLSREETATRLGDAAVPVEVDFGGRHTLAHHAQAVTV